MKMWKNFVSTFLPLLFLSSVRPQDHVSQDQIPQKSQEELVKEAFDPRSGEQGYQRKITLMIAPKTEECYWLENVELHHRINLYFMVTNVDENGKALDISLKVRNPDKKYVKYIARTNEGSVLQLAPEVAGDHEICFNNKYSFFKEKKVVFQFEVEKQLDLQRSTDEVIGEIVSEYIDKSLETKKIINKVRGKVGRMRHSTWQQENRMKKDTARAEAIQEMIDRWSVIHIMLLVAVGFAQVYFLRKMFNVQPSGHGMKMRT